MHEFGVDRDEAARLALARANQCLGFPTGGQELLAERTVETEDGWWFTFETRSYLESGNPDLMAPFGNVPIVVLKRDGSVHGADALDSPEEAIRRAAHRSCGLHGPTAGSGITFFMPGSGSTSVSASVAGTAWASGQVTGLLAATSLMARTAGNPTESGGPLLALWLCQGPL
jgi:hypothetical protein